MGEQAPGYLKPCFACCGGPVGTMEKFMFLVPKDQQSNVTLHMHACSTCATMILHIVRIRACDSNVMIGAFLQELLVIVGEGFVSSSDMITHIKIYERYMFGCKFGRFSCSISMIVALCDSCSKLMVGFAAK